MCTASGAVESQVGEPTQKQGRGQYETNGFKIVQNNLGQERQEHYGDELCSGTTGGCTP